MNEQMARVGSGIRHYRWWVALGLSLIGGIVGVLFGFADNMVATIIFACIFVVGMWLR